MKPERALALLFALVALAPLALAAYDPGSQLEADAPVLLVGRADALASRGVASLLSDDASPLLTFSLRAAEANVRYADVPPACAPAAGIPCIPGATARSPTLEERTLTGVEVTLDRVTGAFKVVATNDPEHADSSSFGAPGPLVVSAASSDLSATTRPLALSPYDEEWTAETSARSDDVYGVAAFEPLLAAVGGGIHATKGFEAMLQGVQVTVRGTDEDGKPFTQTYDTRGGDSSTRFLVIEATEGDLQAASTAPLDAFGVRTVDAHGSASFTDAAGRVVSDGDETVHEGDSPTLAGPLSLTVTKVVKPAAQGDAVRIAFALSDELRVLDAIPPPEKEQDPLQLVAAGAAGASAATLLAGLAYFWPRLKFAATALLLPMYTRIERTAVLEHEKRDEIYELIRATPGIHAHEIGEKARIGWGTTVYHLKLLESHALVVSKKSGRYKRFFVNTGEYTKKKDVYGALRNDTAKAIADHIVAHPGCSQKDLCAALGIQPSLASWHVEKLEAVELVKRVKDGRMVRYFAGPAWEMLQLGTPPSGDAEPAAS